MVQRMLHNVVDTQEIMQAIRQGKTVKRFGDYSVVHGKKGKKRKRK